MTNIKTYKLLKTLELFSEHLLWNWIFEGEPQRRDS